ncbi:hypothetical protein FB451DRAFT_1172422 [Mycena latifolia]|nr:hypothetical protein FB451DRAFT_1172422 [Mycena latifolia]
MQQSRRLENLVGYATVSASTAKAIADSARVPFLGIAAALVLSIAKSVKASEMRGTLKQNHPNAGGHPRGPVLHHLPLFNFRNRRSAPACAALRHREIHRNAAEDVCVYEDPARHGEAQAVAEQADNAARLDACRSELQKSLEIFKVQIGSARVRSIAEIQVGAKERHEELLALLAAHPELADSESSSSVWTSPDKSFRAYSSPLSTGSLSMLPPSPQIFHGRESGLKEILVLLKQDSPRVAILGTGGMGKTSLATAVLHHPDVVADYPHRIFLASHIGIEKTANLARKIARHLSYDARSLLVLDNFETPWEPSASRSEVEEFLSLLADVSNVAVLITMRGAERPGKVRWTRPFLLPLQPLTDSASLQTFIDIADSNHDEGNIRQLLAYTANLPLAVSLIASVAAYEGCESALRRWEIENTRLLSDGYDQKSSLDISIMLSFSSSRMTTEAQELLGLLSILPDGLSDADLVQADLPIPNILGSKSTLIRTSLAYITSDGRLRVLVPIREHIRTIHPPSAALKYSLRQHFHKILDLWKNFDELLPTGIISQITANLGNLNMVLSDALQTEAPDMVANFRSGMFLDDFCFRTNRVSSPLMAIVAERIQSWQQHAVYGEYLLHMVGRPNHVSMQDAEVQISLGHHFFEDREDIERDSNPNLVGRKALTSISLILSKTGNHVDAQVHAQKAQDYAESCGDIPGQAYSVCIEAKCWMALGNFKHAASLCKRGRNLVENTGLQGGTLDVFIQQQEAEIHFLKTEYAEARHIHVLMTDSISPGHLPTSNTVFSQLNLALIDIATGASFESHYLCLSDRETYCDMAQADLYLRSQQRLEANQLLAVCYKAARGKLEEGATFCLERLGDLSHGLNDHITTAGWAGVYIVSALKSKDKLATMKALKCFGELFLADGDGQTALSLFTVAVDGFTFMDVHRWKGVCMTRIADILERGGNISKAVELWTSGRALLERCSQIADVTQVTEKLESFVISGL